MRLPKSRAITFMTIAVIILVYIFAHSYIEEIRLKKACTRSTAATVTEVVHGSREDSAIVSYKAFGMTYSSKLKTDKKVGEKVSICYNPDDPSQICLKTDTSTTEKFGIWLLAIPVALLIFLKKLPQREAEKLTGADKIKNQYKRKLEELKADDNFDYGDD